MVGTISGVIDGWIDITGAQAAGRGPASGQAAGRQRAGGQERFLATMSHEIRTP